MTDIPDDIMKAAEEALDTALCNCVESCGGTDEVRKSAITDIARAILAERNRCASIAEVQEARWECSDFENKAYVNGRIHTAKIISATIRGAAEWQNPATHT